MFIYVISALCAYSSPHLWLFFKYLRSPFVLLLAYMIYGYAKQLKFMAELYVLFPLFWCILHCHKQ